MPSLENSSKLSSQQYKYPLVAVLKRIMRDSQIICKATSVQVTVHDDFKMLEAQEEYAATAAHKQVISEIRNEMNNHQSLVGDRGRNSLSGLLSEEIRC